MTLKVRIRLPKVVKMGQVFEIKTLVSHPMHTGFMVDNRGVKIPRDIITDFTCEYLGEQVFRAEFHPSVAANPYLSFYLKASQSGSLIFTWTDQHGEVTRIEKALVVSN